MMFGAMLTQSREHGTQNYGDGRRRWRHCFLPHAYR